MIFGNSIKKPCFFAFVGFLSLLCLFLACCGPVGGAADIYGGLGAGADPVPFLEKARIGVLPGGLRYYILENSRPENRAFLTLAVNAGSVLETDDEQGLAHFVEHMAFNGTVRFPEKELINYLRSLGMRFGPEVNAYTSYDRTVYGIEVPVETGEDGARRIPDTALAVIDDWTYAVTFDPADVDDERLVIMEEYRSRLGAGERIRQKTLPILFQGSPYAKRNPIGLPDIIEGAPASRLEGFYRKWYRADNMALIFVGDFDAEVLEASLDEHFNIPVPAEATIRPQYDLPNPQRGKTEVLIQTDPELTATRVTVYFKRGREAVRGDLAYFRGEIINILIDRMLDLRFNEAALKPETPYVSAGAGNVRYGTTSRYYVMLAGAKTDMAERTLEELLRQKELMLRYGFTGTELNIAANSLISDMERLVSEKDKQESVNYVDCLTDYYLEGGNLADLEWELDALRRMLPHIKASDINAAIKDYFKWNDVCVFISAPEAEQASLPSEAGVLKMLRDSRKMRITPPADNKVADGFLDYTPVPGTVISETVDEETGAIRWELGNGAQVILKETANRNNEIVMQAMARGGITSVPPGQRISAYLADEMISVSGLGPYSRTELMKKLADKQVSLSFWTANYYRGLQGSATAGDIKNLFEMLYIGFTDPRIDGEAVQVMVDQRRTSLVQRNENPELFFSDEVSKTMYSDHPFFKPLELSDLSLIDTDDALEFIRRGINPADYVFIFTGNLDVEIMRSYVEIYLASIPGQETWNSWTVLEYERPEKSEKLIYKGKEEKSIVYMGWFADMPYSEEASAVSQVLEEYLDIRLTDEIRERLGGVYSISVGVYASPIPKGELLMSVYFSCNPGRVPELTAAVIELLNQTAGNIGTGAAGSLIISDTFNKSVSALKKQWETSLQSNSYIARSYANSAVLFNLPLSRLNRRPQYYDAVTQTDIQSMCAHILARGPVQVILYPEGAIK
jgi:zinc protease